jgi:hypothetical protein
VGVKGEGVCLGKLPGWVGVRGKGSCLGRFQGGWV